MQTTNKTDIVDGLVHIYRFTDEHGEHIGMRFFASATAVAAAAEPCDDATAETWHDMETTDIDDQALDVDQSFANEEAAIGAAYSSAGDCARSHGLTSYYYWDEIGGTEGRRTTPVPVKMM